MHPGHRRRTGLTGHRRALGPAIVVALVTFGLSVGPAAASSSASAQAKKGLLKLSDMPAGWTAAKSSDDNGAIPGATQLAKCLGVPRKVIIGTPPSATSEQFTSKDDLEDASDNVTIYKSVSAARADFNSFATPKTPSCLTTVFNGPAKKQLTGEFGSGATVGAVQVSRSPASAFGPGTANAVIFFPVTMKGVTLNVELILTDYVNGTSEQSVQFIGIQSPVPTSLTKHLTSVADSRI